VTIDGRYITSRGLGTAIPFALAIVSKLVGEDVAQQLSKKIVYTD
jgi:4-methyl-5(b-hydroxyethyl)-thiazole monophosphate biosynthesis